MAEIARLPFGEANADKDRDDAIVGIARRVGDLSVAVAGVSGDVNDCAKLAVEQRERFRGMNERAQRMSEGGVVVKEAASRALETSKAAEVKMGTTSANLSAMVGDVNTLTGQVSSISSHLSQLQETLQRVAKVSQHVASISRQTNLLSLNASIEAARAGQHGRGFMVVAGEVKELSNQAGQATSEIGDTIEELGEELQKLMKQAVEATDLASEISDQTGGLGDDIEQIPVTLGNVRGSQEDIVSAVSAIDQSINETNTDIDELMVSAEQSTNSLSQASEALLTITDSAEALTGMSAKLGVETVDTPFIEEVQRIARDISSEFEEGVRRGRILESDLFDENYREIGGSDPQQHMTRFTHFTDQTLPKFQEPMFQFSNKVVFCATVDRNGYLPTHNHKFSQPQQHGHPEWNAKHSRNRRIFDDRVGLGAGQSTRPFLLQAYRRDMGNGEFRMMKDVSAPIIVRGRHWGGVRLAYTCD